MDYISHYNSLIQKSKNRKLQGYTEIHHVIPRCMGGSNDKDNLVILTAREHFIAHLLLYKIYPKNLALVKAIYMMCIGHSIHRISNRFYERYKIDFAKAQSISQTGEGNSQYRTVWIHNILTNESKKIVRGQMLEPNWQYGRYSKHIKPVIISKKIIAKEARKELLRYYYPIYIEHGFARFVQITGYDKSIQNLVQGFSTYLEEFIPQNGKRRGCAS